MRYLLLHTSAWDATSVGPALERAQIEARQARLPRDLAVDERPTVFLLDPESRSTFPLGVLRAFIDAGGAIVAVGRNGETDVPAEMPAELLSGFVRPPVGTRQLLVAVRAGYREAAARVETARARAEAASRSREIGELTRIGVALGTERDVKSLLDLILTQARRITSSDAGSLYLVETGDQGQKRLRFRLAQTYSKPEAPFIEFTIPVDRSSLAGYTAVTGEPLVIDDAYFLPPDVEYSINRSFDQRDPTTFGHSGRVANMTVGLAVVVDRAGDGAYQGVRFTREQIRELRYAGLLHDFGKVGVREQVLVKAKKLYPLQLELIRQRYDFVRRTAEREFWRRRAEFLEAHGRQGYEEFVAEIGAEHARETGTLDRFLEAVLRANEPTVLPAEQFEELLALARCTYQDLSGEPRPYLSDEEMRYLTIPKGSLDESERLEIESHVTNTYRFLQQIPWTRELQQVPMIAYGHHEKLDGGGYPRPVAGPPRSSERRRTPGAAPRPTPTPPASLRAGPRRTVPRR